MAGIVGDDKCYDIVFDSWLYQPCITALGILSMETRGKNSSLFGMSAIFLSISYGVIGSIPRALFVTTLWIWAVAFLVSGLLFVMQIKKLLSKMEKGEVLCTN